MDQSVAVRCDAYQVAQYNATAPSLPMYSGQQLQPPPYCGQPLQPPPMATAPAAWGYPPQAAYEAASGCKAGPQAYGDPMSAGAYPQNSVSGYATQPGTAPAFYPSQVHYQPPPQQSVNVAVSTAPAVTIVHQPLPVVTTMGVVKSYMAWSLVSLIILFWPLGIPALIYSLKVKSATTPGDKSKYSLLARNFNIAATVVGPLLVIILASSISSVRKTYYTTYYYYYYNSYYNSYYYYYG